VDRNTDQRKAIRTVFDRPTRPLSPTEIHETARKKLPNLGIATVYRTLNLLVSQGWLVEVELPGEPSRYERADIPHHHHFHCRSCGKVFDLKGCSGNFRSLVPRGFKMDSHEVVLYGRCKECVAA